MKVLEILVENEDGGVQLRTEFSAREIQYLLQFAFNASASIGLRAQLKALEDEAMEQELND